MTQTWTTSAFSRCLWMCVDEGAICRLRRSIERPQKDMTSTAMIISLCWMEREKCGSYIFHNSMSQQDELKNGSIRSFIDLVKLICHLWKMRKLTGNHRRNHDQQKRLDDIPLPLQTGGRAHLNDTDSNGCNFNCGSSLRISCSVRLFVPHLSVQCTSRQHMSQFVPDLGISKDSLELKFSPAPAQQTLQTTTTLSRMQLSNIRNCHALSMMKTWRNIGIKNERNR